MRLPGTRLVRGVSVERVIPAPASRVFALLADPRRHREFDGSGTVRDAVADPAEPTRLAQGDVFGMHMRMGGAYRMTNTVVEFEQDRRIAWQPRPTNAVAALAVGGRIWRYELEPVDGGTRVRETWDITEERFPPLLWAMRGLTRRNMARTLSRLEGLAA